MIARRAAQRFNSDAPPSTGVHSVVPDGLRVIISLAFDHRVPPAELSAFKAALIDSPSVVNSVETIGSFDFVFEARLTDMGDYNEWLQSMAVPLARNVARYEASFVGKRFVRESRLEQAIWVPSEYGMKRIDCSVIDKVRAEGDYMRIYSDGGNWMVHSTMHSLVEQLPPENFIQINRSAVIRYGFIERLIHEGRTWRARLADGCEERIAKSHVAEVLRALRNQSSKR